MRHWRTRDADKKITLINSSQHHFSPGKAPSAELGPTVWLPAPRGTTELGGGHSPSPAIPSSGVTNDSPCPWPNLGQTLGGGQVALWQHQHQHGDLQPSHTQPQVGVSPSLLPHAMGVAALTHKVWVQRVLTQGGWWGATWEA